MGMRNQFTFTPNQKPIIEHGRALQNVEFKGVTPNFPAMNQASNLSGTRAFGMPNGIRVNYDVEGTKFSFYIMVAVDFAAKSKEVAQTFERPIPPNCPIDNVKYHGALQINCNQIDNRSYAQSMYVLAQIVAVKSFDEMIDVYSNGNKQRCLESLVVLELSLRTNYSPMAFMPGSFKDQRWDKTVKYLQVPMPGTFGRSLKVTEGIDA